MADFPSRDRDAFMAHWAKLMADEAVTKRVILFADQVVGNIASFDRDGQREVGYWIDREHWGMGIATRALAEFLQIETKRPLYACVAKHNIASARVLQKCGFTICGDWRGAVGAASRMRACRPDLVTWSIISSSGSPPCSGTASTAD